MKGRFGDPFYLREFVFFSAKDVKRCAVNFQCFAPIQNYLRAMRMRWFAIGAAIVLMAACFFPWVIIESKNIMVSGVEAKGTSFGKPGVEGSHWW